MTIRNTTLACHCSTEVKQYSLMAQPRLASNVLFKDIFKKLIKTVKSCTIILMSVPEHLPKANI
jgi:hypothetical protein